jgi:hypothetical protein
MGCSSLDRVSIGPHRVTEHGFVVPRVYLWMITGASGRKEEERYG